jgi:hypothetical protein
MGWLSHFSYHEDRAISPHSPALLTTTHHALLSPSPQKAACGRSSHPALALPLDLQAPHAPGVPMTSSARTLPCA